MSSTDIDECIECLAPVNRHDNDGLCVWCRDDVLVKAHADIRWREDKGIEVDEDY